MGNQNVDVKKATFKTVVNKGQVCKAATIASNVLKGIGDNLNKQITNQSLHTLEKQNVQVNAADIAGITNPVKVDTKEINKVKIIKVEAMLRSNVYASLDEFTCNISIIILCFQNK